MSSTPNSIDRDRDPGVSAEQVAAYLRRNPDFLAGHPELSRVLTPPSRRDGDGVLDLQTFMIDRLRAEIRDLEGHRGELVAAGRRNRSKQTQVHAAVIAMLGATTFEHFIEVVTGDLVRLLHVDVVALCVEGNDGARRRCTGTGIHGLEPGTVDELLGAGRETLLGGSELAERRVFDAGVGLVRSAALVRLDLGRGPVCLLGLGSRQADRFEPGQGTELLGFLARVLEHCLRVWLNLPR